MRTFIRWPKSNHTISEGAGGLGSCLPVSINECAKKVPSDNAENIICI